MKKFIFILGALSEITFGQEYAKYRTDTVLSGSLLDFEPLKTPFIDPFGIVFDSKGNLFVADSSNNAIYKIFGTERISLFAGANGPGYLDGPGSSAKFNGPSGLTIDQDDNLYVSDSSNYVIRKISPDSRVTTLAGNKTSGFTDGQGSVARIGYVRTLSYSPADGGKLYFSDTSTIRTVNLTGFVSTVAGSKNVNGFIEGQGSAARFPTALGLVADSLGNLYFSENWNYAVWKMNATGYCSVLAGGKRGLLNGLGRNASFNDPFGLALDSTENLYVADYRNNVIRKIDQVGNVSTLAGNGIGAYFNGLKGDASFFRPISLKFNAKDNLLYVLEFMSPSIRQINLNGLVSDYISSFSTIGIQDGKNYISTFKSPFGLLLDSAKNILYVADSKNFAIRAIDLLNFYQVSTISGNGFYGTKDGTWRDTEWSYPLRMVFDRFGDILVSQGSSIKKMFVGNKTVTTLIGNGTRAGYVNGPSDQALLDKPHSIVPLIPNDTILFSENLYGDWRKFENNSVSTFFGKNSYGCVDGSPAVGKLTYAYGGVLTPDGYVYFADRSCNSIRKMSLQGVVSVYAGQYGKTGIKDGNCSGSLFGFPTDIIYDARTNSLIVTDTFAGSVRKIDLGTDQVTTLLQLSQGIVRDGPTSISAVTYPASLAVDNNGTIYIADSTLNSIKMIKDGILSTIAGSGAIRFFPETNNAVSLRRPTSLIALKNGDLVITDTLNNCLVKISSLDGVATILSGNGGSGWRDSLENPLNVQFYQPRGIAYNGSFIFVTDTRNHLIRSVDPSSGATWTFAGIGSMGSYNSLPLNSSFNNPWGIEIDALGNIFIGDSGNNQIRMISENNVTTLCGSTEKGFLDGAKLNARFNSPTFLHVARDGFLYVSDTNNHAIRRVNISSGMVETISGVTGLLGKRDGNNSETLFYFPGGISSDNFGNLIVGDTYNNAIRMIIPKAGNFSEATVTTLSSNGSNEGGFVNGLLSDSIFKSPMGIYIDNKLPNAPIYVADMDNNAIRVLQIPRLKTSTTFTLPIDEAAAAAASLPIIIIGGVLATLLVSTTVVYFIGRSGRKAKTILQGVADKKSESGSSQGTEQSKTLSTSKTVPIAIPGFLAIDIRKSFHELSISQKLGSGGTGSIVKGIFRDVDLIKKHGFNEAAIKFFSKSTSDEDFRYEVALMASLPKTEYVIQLIAYSEEPKAIVMPIYPMGLADLLKDASFGNTRKINVKIASEIATGMSLIHAKGIIHFDLKPGNVLVNFQSGGQFNCVICDFGFANFTTDAQANLVKGLKRPTTNGITYRYAAPELFSKVISINRLSSEVYKKVDVFAYAMTIFNVFFRTKPWGSLPQDEIEKQVIQGNRPEFPTTDFAINELIEKGWSQEPQERPDFSWIVTWLQQSEPNDD